MGICLDANSILPTIVARYWYEILNKHHAVSRRTNLLFHDFIGEALTSVLKSDDEVLLKEMYKQVKLSFWYSVTSSR